MKQYVKASIATANGCKVRTPYDNYVFSSDLEAREFCDYVNSDPEYSDPEIGMIIEHCFFINKAYPDK